MIISCNTIVDRRDHVQYLANIFPAHPPDPRGQKVKIQLFQNMVMLHIKLNAITKCSNMVAHNPHSKHPL